jgi:chromosome segregation ATPase
MMAVTGWGVALLAVGGLVYLRGIPTPVPVPDGVPAAVTGELARVQADCRELVLRGQELEAALLARSNEWAEVRQSLEQEKATHEPLRRQIESQSAREIDFRFKLEREIEATRKSNESLRAAEKNLTDLRQELAGLRTKLEALQSEREQSQDTFAVLRRTNDVLSARIRSMQVEVDETTSAKREAEQEWKRMLEERNQALATNQVLVAQVQSLQLQADQWRKAATRAEAQVAEMKVEIDKLLRSGATR